MILGRWWLPFLETCPVQRCWNFSCMVSMLIFAFSRISILVTKSLQGMLRMVRKQCWWKRSKSRRCNYRIYIVIILRWGVICTIQTIVLILFAILTRFRPLYPRPSLSVFLLSKRFCGPPIFFFFFSREKVGKWSYHSFGALSTYSKLCRHGKQKLNVTVVCGWPKCTCSIKACTCSTNKMYVFYQRNVRVLTRKNTCSTHEMYVFYQGMYVF